MVTEALWSAPVVYSLIHKVIPTSHGVALAYMSQSLGPLSMVTCSLSGIGGYGKELIYLLNVPHGSSLISLSLSGIGGYVRY